jgi:energy-converting hydrogenase A subunit R
MREFVQERKYFSDVEGPYSLNDNALEIAGSLIRPYGHKLFYQLSMYDDYLVDIEKKPNYNSGCTLGLLLPFFKAFGATNNLLESISLKNVKLLPGTKDTLQFLLKKMECYLVSTSYEQHIRAFCKATQFPFVNTVCTKLDLDNEKFEFNGKENDWLKKRAKEIVSLPKIKFPINSNSRDELPDDVLSSIERLDQIFWDEMENEYLKSFELLKSVNTIGGPKKEQAILERTSDLSNIVYTGDSITDREALSRVKREGGLSVSSNGDMYALNEAEIGCIIDNTIVTAVIVDAFYNSGKEGALDLVDNWNLSGLKKAKEQTLVYPKLISELLTLYPKKLPEVVILTDVNREEFGKKSTYFGSKLREGKVYERN